jgi:hypothetical protein
LLSDLSEFTESALKGYLLQKSCKYRDGNWPDQSIRMKSRLAVQKALDEAFVESYGAEDEE